MFIAKNAVENQQLLAGGMLVAGQRAAWRIPDNAGRARYFVTDSVEHQAIDARFRRTDLVVQQGTIEGPLVRFLRNNDRLFGEFCVYSHGLSKCI